MTNPDNIVRVRARNGGRASVYEANGWAQAFTSGLLEGNGVTQNTSADMNVLVGGSANKPDVVLAENASGYRIALDIVGQQAIAITAPASNSRISAIVAYTDDLSLSTTEDTVTGSPASCGLIVVNGTAASSPVEPTDAQIRSAITADGATGSQASYCVIATVLVASNATMITDTLITINKAGLAGTGVVSSDNIDYATLPHYEVNSTTNMNIGSGSSSFVTVLSLQIADPGYYYVYGYCGVYKSSTSEVCDVRTRIQGGNWMPYSIFHMYGSGQYDGGAVGGIIKISSANTTINLQVNQTNGNITMRTEYLRNMCAFKVG